MRRFELVEGKASKFWEVQADGCDVTVRFGRIGTSGQTKTKTLASEAAATKEHDALVKEKVGKGYAEVATAAGQALAAAPKPIAPSPAPATSAASATAATPATSAATTAPPPILTPTSTSAGMPSVAAAHPAPAVPPSSAATAIEWPGGGFAWTDEWRAKLPVVRGIHVPPVHDRAPPLDEPIVFADDSFGHHAAMLAELAKAAGRTWTYWGAQRSKDLIRRETLEQADSEFWLELLAQAAVSPLVSRRSFGQVQFGFHYVPDGMHWVCAVGIERHGIPFMAERALDLERIASGLAHHASLTPRGLLPLLRQAIASCDDARHDAVIAMLDAQAGATPLDRRTRAYLCPHRRDWVEFSAAERTDESLLLKDGVMSVEAFTAYTKGIVPWYPHIESALALQLHLHGDAAFGVVAHLLRRMQDHDGTDKLVALALRSNAAAMVPLFAELIERKRVRAALDKVGERYPAGVLKCVVEHAIASRSRLAEGWAVRLALREPAALAQVLPTLSSSDRAHVEALLRQLQSSEASAEALPPLLREPPWLRKARPVELPTIDIEPKPTPSRVLLTAHEKDQASRFVLHHWVAQEMADPARGLDSRGLGPSAVKSLLRGEPLAPGSVTVSKKSRVGEWVDGVLALPDHVGLALWNSCSGSYWHTYGETVAALRAILARHDVRALPGFLAFVATHTEIGLIVARAVDSPGIVPMALHALRNTKKARDAATTWLRTFPATAVAAALPVAFGSGPKAERDDARFGVRWLAGNGFEDEARRIAAEIGGEIPQALQALLDADPLLVLPARVPKLPNFFVPASFRRPGLRGTDHAGGSSGGSDTDDTSGDALPTSAMEHLGTMLAMSKLDAPYPGLAVVKEACTAASLAEFAWDVYEAWQAAGAPSKEGWAFTALGLLGDDETARRLAPRIREWPGESQHQRAVTGLDILAAIGSDVALMHLNGIAAKVKFKGLHDRAKEKIAAVAEARGFTSAELADRLVPDLGLDEQGTLELDFGPRRFYVGFDESLEPFVKDAQGARLKDLPKPIKSDDAALADAAVERYKLMKKDAKAIASLQVMRLEMSMIDRRRWSAADFELFFLGHPLMRHLAARVVWGLYDALGKVTGAFRVAEDWTLADGNDEAMTLPAGAQVGIVHVLEMPQAMQAAFGQVFADYEILQPFKQLGRETYTLTAAELAAGEITRYADKTVATGSVMGLVKRGWERGQAQDAGWVGWFGKPVGQGLEVDLELDPGTVVGDVSYEPKQCIPRITLRRAGTYDQGGKVGLDQLDPIIASEVLRDAELLAPFKES